MSKNSRRCGTKRISKSKSTKHAMLGPLFQVNNFTTQHAQESTNPSHPTFLLAGLTRCLRSKQLFLVLLAKLWCQHPWPTTYLPTHNRSSLPWVSENSPTPPPKLIPKGVTNGPWAQNGIGIIRVKLFIRTTNVLRNNSLLNMLRKVPTPPTRHSF